ncbi:protein DpdJ [Corallococcus sp. bb12-1]|uniref:protein DpdJ n=1 Tax=Corallococcus sp. bb12-1 TaxID=2996784 RepID=UPI002270113D|nr:protein DpdJ [Corallococcus sp. bb12-1]MCY1045627.1 protein DpdJ [Corallococcus sp. bb12-1]
MDFSTLASKLLDRLEMAEMRLLTWGCVEGALTSEELEAHARAILEESHGSTPVAALPSSEWELIEALLKRKVLWSVPLHKGRYRTRMAEAVRLFSRLRQILPQRNGPDWKNAPTLVADYRLLVRPREFPRRNIPREDVLARVPWPSPIARKVGAAMLTRPNGKPLELASYQVRSTTRILDMLATRNAGGTVVAAGTGSGKTLAFYLPAFAAIADRAGAEAWTKSIAIYPRNELLKDQFRTALGNALRTAPALREAGKAPVSLGALYQDVPDRARYTDDWVRTQTKRGPARLCPFVRCPECGEQMAWPETHRKKGEERLVCTGPSCSIEIGPDILRLTRERQREAPPDILFTSTEILNQRLADADYSTLLGVGLVENRRPFLILLDEVHTYEGHAGAHVALLLRRWRAATQARPHVVGLSATLADAPRFLAELSGSEASTTVEVSPSPGELEPIGTEYMLALRGDPSSGTSLLSTSIQAVMLLRRVLALNRDDPDAGKRVFAFADNLDVVNRLYFSTLDAEGWRRPGTPLSNRPIGSLANFRSPHTPDADVRLRAGQNWKLATDIGHVLAPNSRATVSRTSSQDTGVDRESDIVIATASLEVGFDDPDVGGVLQHKAPKSAAGFLQRKGRAGRRIGTRPWTVVTLSDFGRDRGAYQAYERLFSPVLPPRFLPVGNRAVLRMQATYALFDWLASKVSGPRPVSPWRDLARPAGDGDKEKTHQAVGQRQQLYMAQLQRLLTEPAAREEFKAFLQVHLRLPLVEAEAVLWEPPRAVLLEAVPTLLRRLETDWKRVDGSGLELHTQWGPLPDFVQKTLFGELLVPEVELILQPKPPRQPRTESMLIAHALREFAPGRVSRRYGDRSAEDRFWIDPGAGATLSLDIFCPPANREFIGHFRYRDGAGVQTAEVYRPYALRATLPPLDIDSGSNAFPVWSTEIVVPVDAEAVGLPPASSWSERLKGVAFHTHAIRRQVEVRRFVTASELTTLRRRVREERHVRLTVHEASGEAERPAALGFAADVDAVSVRFRYPLDLVSRCTANARLLRALRVARFRDAVREEPILDGLANSFQRDPLAEAWLAGTTLEALRRGVPLAEASDALLQGATSASLREILDRLFLWTGTDSRDEDTEDEDEEPSPDGTAIPKRLADLHRLIAMAPVREALHRATGAMSQPPDAAWDSWLRRRFKTSLGAAFHEAAADLCPDMDPDSLVVDLNASPDVEPSGDEDIFWLTETLLGGGGFVEKFHEKFAADPRRFLRLLDSRLTPSDAEWVGTELERILERLAGAGERDQALIRAVADVRTAQGHMALNEALHALRTALAHRGISPTPTLLVSMNTRLLAPGTRPETDAFLSGVFARWRADEERLGIDIDSRLVALLYSHDTDVEEALQVTPDGASPGARAAWRSATVRGMVWERGGRLRAETLRVHNPFSRSPECDRLIVRTAVGDQVPDVSLADPQWLEVLARALETNGAAHLVARADQARELAAALAHLTCERIDLAGLYVYPRLEGVSRDAEDLRALLEVPEALQ